MIAKSQVILVGQFYIEKLLNNFFNVFFGKNYCKDMLKILLKEKYQVQKP